MIKKNLEPGLVQYIFEPLPGRCFSNSITALIHDNNALLIDTAFEGQALAVLDDLDRNSIKIDAIIISHFHDDHMQGLKVLPGGTVFGSAYYRASLDLWTDPSEHKYYVPTDIIGEEYTIDFYGRYLTLIPLPGHSLCTVITKIDGKYIHIADELIFSPDGRPILPSADPGCIQRHIDSLEQLKQYTAFTLIPGHGPEIHGEERIIKEINNRISYFQAIHNSKSRISYEEAAKGCNCEFLHHEWHEFVYE